MIYSSEAISAQVSRQKAFSGNIQPTQAPPRGAILDLKWGEDSFRFSGFVQENTSVEEYEKVEANEEKEEE